MGEAERIAGTVVEEGLAACANILGPCRSIYRWQGRTERAEEVPALFKTARAEALIARIAALHSYDVPAVMAFAAGAVHPAYRDWVVEATAAQISPASGLDGSA
ncbi:divalent cation tolerance protein CutA [Sphingomonas changnyeongensis]|uniref:Divalent cation tolerance protein CutA n=2 Tax=Sphingomonas changnyeongensis TaxID=2698679 RepID=A0A7Z2NYS5_9SPHN|nr:divalent cation tolerance protein CutA [Sphingomonas changnyeongensis]